MAKLNIIYHCYGGTHSSVTAAAVHLNWLPAGKKPARKDLLQIPYFDTRQSDGQGCIMYMGTDENNNDVYILGRGHYDRAAANIMYKLAEIYSIPRNSFLLINAMPCVNIFMRVGGVLSRQWGLVKPGRFLVALGTTRAYSKITVLVKQVKGDREKGS